MRKKLLLTLTAVALVVSLGTASALAVSGNRGAGFMDEDGDGICDNRGVGFMDEDGDGICDNRGAGFADEDGDGICDNRGAGFGRMKNRDAARGAAGRAAPQ